MQYIRLTREERYQIQALSSSGQGIRQIARVTFRNPSTISRELRTGARSGKYCAEKADQMATKLRCRPKLKNRRIVGALEKHILAKLEEDWSPEQIWGRCKLEKRPCVSPPTIYRYIYRDRKIYGQLWRHLRILRIEGKDRRKTNRVIRRYLPERLPISDRPTIVEKRIRLGDYERDTVLGKRGRSALLTAVDRTSRLLKLAWLPKNSCEAVHRATVSLLKNEPLKTITNDNGFEFIRHKKTSKSLGTAIYFSKAFRSWERGTNENTNGLLRQYFPKKKDIGTVRRSCIRKIEHRINSRPRKTLGYRTPLEVHRALSQGVALDM